MCGWLPLRQGGVGLAVSPETAGVGAPTGLLQALLPVGARELLPLLPDCVGPGAAAKFLPGVPPYATRHALERALVGLVARVGAHWVRLMARMGALGAVRCPFC